MWEVFTFLITNTKFIRLYDGFMGRTSMDVLKGMGIQDVAVVRMPSSVPNNGRTTIMESADSSFETMERLKAWATFHRRAGSRRQDSHGFSSVPKQ